MKEIKIERKKLTEEQKKEICKYKQCNPKVNQKEIVKWFEKKYNRSVTIPTISYTLRNSIHNIDINKAIEKLSLTNKNRINKSHPMTLKKQKSINFISSPLNNNNDLFKNIEKNKNMSDDINIAINNVKSLINFFTHQNGDFTNEIIDLANIMKCINKF